MIDKEQNSTVESDEKVDHKQPTDEELGFYFSSAVKIIDIDTGEVLLKIRGD